MTYFTCKFLKNVGIGDQLYQLQTLYNLGKTIGFNYIYSPLPPSRWCDQLNISEFLGLGIEEETLDSCRNHKIIDVDAYKATSLFMSSKNLTSVFKVSKTSKVIYRLVFSEKLYRENPSYLELPLSFKIDFRKKFLLSQKSSPNIYNPFKDNLISVAVHIRRGDCTWLEDSGKYFFPYMNKIINSNPTDVDVCRALPHSNYINLLETIFQVYDYSLFEIKVYSDGIPEVFWMDTNLFQKFKYWLSTSPLSFLFNRNQRITQYNDTIFNEELKKRFNELKNEFEAYKKYPNVTVNIGKDVELTKEIITAFAMADIVIVAREDAFPEIGLHDSNSRRILMNAKTNQLKNIKLIENFISRH